MSTISVKFHFNTIVAVVQKDEIIEHLIDTGDYDPGELESLSYQELLAQLNENGVDEFFENGGWDFPEAIRCDVAEDE